MSNNKSLNQTGRFALVNGRVILPDRVEVGLAVVVEGDVIAGVVRAAELGSEVERIDVGGRLISPGLIDIHTHGAYGHTFNEPTVEAFSAITARNASHGTTSLLATTSTAPVSDLVASLEFIWQWMGEGHAGAQILGAHVEGPYFALAQAGAQDPTNILNPADHPAGALLKFHDIIRIFTFAPELPGALALTAQLAELGIVPAAGHSSAREEEIIPAIAAGLSHIIHIWSAQSTTIRQGPWRKPGLLEVSLTYEDLTVEMICDNKHLPPTLMRLAYKCIGPDRLCVISDATSGAGLPEGSRYRMGEMEYEVCDGVGMMLDRSSFAGSTTLLNQMIPILAEQVGIPLPEAVRMASLTPARVIGIDGRKGSLEAGKDADIVIFDDDFTAWRVLIGGRWM
ncbi:MAG: N-acetylglucosamine-6-phosphate deacetylase [Caldilineales bacterium]|nr:N-acetylglucosamine-6-phosphate deacetylase [Caldilineales bacterium]